MTYPDPNQPTTGGQYYPQTSLPTGPQAGPPSAPMQPQYGQYEQPAAAYGQQYPPQAPYGYGVPNASPAAAVRRPGAATATGVIGIVVGVCAFGYAATLAIIASVATDAVSNSSSDSFTDGGSLAVTWVVAILALAASVLIFVGAIQVLNGSNVTMARIGSVLALLSIWIYAIWALTKVGDSVTVTVIVTALLFSVCPALVLIFSLNAQISNWVAQKRASDGLPV